MFGDTRGSTVKTTVKTKQSNGNFKKRFLVANRPYRATFIFKVIGFESEILDLLKIENFLMRHILIYEKAFSKCSDY